MAIQKYSDYIEEKKKQSNTQNNLVLPSATIQKSNIQKYSDYIKNIPKKDIKQSNAISYIGNSALTGLAGGLTGVGNAVLTDTANDLKKGSKNNIINSALSLLNSVFKWKNPINALTSNTINSLKKNFIDDKDSNIIQKAVNSALDIASPETPINKTVQLYGSILPDNASDSVLKANDIVSQPYNKLKETTQEQAKTQSPVVQVIGNTVQNVGQMLPSIAATAITRNPNVGLATMGISTKGLSTQEALAKGADLDKAIKIGNIKGQVEIGTEMLTGGLNIFGKGSFDDIVKTGIIDKAKTIVGKYLLEKGYEVGGEVLEETISDIVGTIIDKGTVDENASYNLEDWSETALVTVLSTVALNVLTGGLSGNINKTDINKIQDNNLQNNLVEKSAQDNQIINNEQNTSSNTQENIENEEQEITNIEATIKELESQREKTIQKAEQKRLDNQIKSLQEQLNTIQNQIENTTNTQNSIDESQTNVNNVDNQSNKISLPTADNILNKVNIPGIDNNSNVEPNNGSFDLKQQQLDIISKSNPMLDDYHIGIRNIDDIKTFDEVINDDESFVWGDYSREDALRDLQKGTVMIYSSTPIENGNFVSTSRNQARDYAGEEKIYSKEVPLTDVAWINGDEGQYAKVEIKPNLPMTKNIQNINIPNIKNESLNVNDKTYIKAINDFENAKNTVDRQTIIDLSTRTNLEGKNFKNRYIDENMSKRMGKNTNPKIINIDNVFDGVTQKNAITYIKEAMEKAKTLFDGKKYNVIDTNTDVELNKTGIKETYQPSKQITPEKIQSSGKMGDIINQGVYAYTTDNTDGKPQKLHNFYSAINYKGKNELMRVVIKESTDGSFKTPKFYYHQLELINYDIMKNTPLDRQGKSSKPVVSDVFSNKDNTTNNKNSQIAPLSNTNNTQNNEKNVLLPSARVQNEINEMEGLKAANDAFGLSEEETKRLDSLRKKYDKEYITEKKFKTAEKKILSQTTNEANSNLGLTAKESKEFKEKLKKLTNNTKEELTNELAKNDVRKIISDYSERTIKHSNTDIEEIKRKIRNKNIKVSDYLKNQITDYGDFKKRNFGKLRLTNDGIAVDSFYEELKSEYPSYFSSDVMNDADILETLADFMDKDTSYEESFKLPDDEINEIADKVYNKILDNSLTLDEIDNIDKEIYDRISKKTRKDVQEQLLEEMGITTDDLQVGKDISSLAFQRTDPIRVNEKVFGYEIGKKINDATINKTKHNEAERNRFLNRERQEIKDLGIKARSKESAAVQKYGEKQYVDDKGTIREYGDYELAQEFPNVETQNKIKKAARELRKKYDNYIDQINNVITNMGYDAIPKRPDYMRHFQELNDKLSQWGIPLNPNDLNSDSLPTDINGITDQFRPGKNWFASAMPREGLKTTYDAITGIDGYLEGASNLIYHTEDIQRYRSLSKAIRETYGQMHGLDNIDKMSSDDAQQRITDVFNNKLSKYVAWLDEQANALAGKKGAIDRGAERALGRRIYKILDTAKKQVGSNMTGFNVRSALTNFASAVQGASKTNKIAFIKGTISSLNNIIHDDGLIDKSDFLTSRLRNSDMISKKLWQKASNASQILMTGSDYFTANQIWRGKYYENLQNGMDETEAIKNADDFAARIMGDRSKGSTAEIFNSKTLGLLTQFQLEVNNQWSSIIHDNKMDIQSGNKSGATVLFQLGQLAAMSYFFNNFMKSITGSSVMIDPIDMLKKILGYDDDEDKTIEERTKEVLGDLVDNLPFVSFLTGGRIPISEAFTGLNTAFNFATGKTDNYGNEITSEDVKDDVISSALYWLLPTGYGQLKKSIKGLNMYDTSLPIAGSYTDSGNLRFTADTTAPGIIKAALFGQYSSKEAQKYIDSGYSYINKSKIDELKELNMTASQYRKYRTNLNNSGTTNAEKIEFISNSNYSNEQKNIMARDVLNESEEKYAVATQISPSYYKYAMWKSEIQNIKNNTTNDKQETIDYINNLELSIPQKAMFIKMYYKTFKQYDTEIVNYINEQNLTIDEKAEILTSLGFTIRDGRVYS